MADKPSGAAIEDYFIEDRVFPPPEGFKERSLAASPLLFPPSVVEMVAVAEETGRLDKELLRLSTSYEGELDRRLRMLVALAEPILLFIMAGLIGTVVVGMLLPVFTLQDLVH